MKKIPCLFQRDFQTRTLIAKVAPGCEWVFTPEATATVKYDGTATMVLNGRLYKRLDCRKDRRTNEYKPPPPLSIPCDEPDPITGHWPHWVLISNVPEDKWFRAAWQLYSLPHHVPLPDGTYELCGPHFNGNPQAFLKDVFIRHGDSPIAQEYFASLSTLCDEDKLTFFRDFLSTLNNEGIVFHHPDGRMAKIRRADFGLPWGSKGPR
jgi:hypothetical protein